jgi:hypothetical protein
VNLIYQQEPKVTLATNTFIAVPTILQFDNTPLISVVRDQDLTHTTEIPIYHQDGTYLAKVRGTRVFATEAGRKAGIEIRRLPKTTVCTLNKRTVFEIQHQSGDAFKAYAELHTPTGVLVKIADEPLPGLVDASGQALKVGGLVMSRCTFEGMRIGIWVRSNGSVAIGVS